MIREPFFILGVTLFAVFVTDYLMSGRLFGLAVGGSFGLLCLAIGVMRKFLETRENNKISDIDERLKRVEAKQNRGDF